MILPVLQNEEWRLYNLPKLLQLAREGTNDKWETLPDINYSQEREGGESSYPEPLVQKGNREDIE